MKKLLFASLILLSTNCFSQNVKKPVKPVSDSLTITVSKKDVNALLQWIDNLHADNLEVKAAEKIILNWVDKK